MEKRKRNKKQYVSFNEQDEGRKETRDGKTGKKDKDYLNTRLVNALSRQYENLHKIRIVLESR